MPEYEARILERHGNLISVVTPDSISYDRQLRAGGKCTLELPLDQAAIADPMVLQPWAREVMLRRRETPSSPWVVAHDGPITGVDFDLTAGKATVTAGTVKAFLTKRKGGNFFYEPNYDLGAIANLIITRAQDRGLSPPPAGSTFFCDHPLVTTGVTRTFDNRNQNTRRYDEILDEVAQGDPGFDYEFTTTYDGATRTRTFVLHYPHQGSDSTIPLILGGSLTGLNVSIDGDRAATHYNVWGTPKGGLTKLGNTFVADSVIDIYTRLEEDETRADVDDLDRLHDISLEALRVRTPPLYLISGAYQVSAATPWRFAGIGDTVQVKASRGPVQFNSRRRIIGEAVTVNAGSETVGLQFNDPIPA